MPVERSELELVWPPSLFAAEATALLDGGLVDEDTMGWLLGEAFHRDRGFRLFTELHEAPSRRIIRGAGVNAEVLSWGRFGPPERSSTPDPARVLVEELVRDADALPRYRPKRYYSQRRRPQQLEAPLTPDALKAAFAAMAHELDAKGYFGNVFGSSCVDDADDPDREGQRWLAEAVGHDAQIWPLGRLGEPTDVEQTWDDELFLDVVEALHDAVARPRRRYWHDYGREWDYAEFARRPGQAVYRWRVNDLLDRSKIDLRLADGGEDEGLLVHAAGDERDVLVQQVLATPDPRDREATQHAVALIRGRHAATREEKRSAVLALARVLESRRPLIEAALTKKDAGALFQIANEFDLRHRGAPGTGREQREDYADAFLDWVYWWYLATVELTDRLLAEQGRTS